MKLLLSFLIIVMTSLSINGYAQKYNSTENNPIWKQQLEETKKNGEEALKRNLPTSKNELRLVDYKYIGNIDSKREIEKIKQQLLSSKNSYFPYTFDNNLQLLTFKEIDIKNAAAAANTKSVMSDYLNKIITCDLKKIKLTWLHNNRTYNTLCLVSDIDGVIYDNIISNLFLYNKANEETKTIEISPIK